MQHRATPDHRIGFVREHEADGHHPDAVLLQRDDHLIDHGRTAPHPEHPGNREPVHIRVDDADPVAQLPQRDRQVHRDRGLPHAALPTGDGEDADGRLGGDEGGAAGGADLAAAQLGDQRLTLVGRHLAQGDVHFPYARNGAHALTNAVDDGLAQRAGADGQEGIDADAPITDLNVAHHVQIHDALVQLRVFDASQRLQHLLAGDDVRISGHGAFLGSQCRGVIPS